MSFQFSQSAIKLSSPLVTLEEKLYFLKKYVTPHAVLHFDGKDNVKKLDIVVKSPKTLQDKLLNRVGYYLKTGTISLASLNVESYGYSRKSALAALRELIDRINIQFDMYVRANQSIAKRIGVEMNDGLSEFQKLYETPILKTEYDKNDIVQKFLHEKQEKIKNPIPHDCVISEHISGISDKWNAHNYQIDFINLCRHNLLWINAYATGLGKTSTSLMVIQDQQNLGLKNKTIFLVPKSTLSKWHKESMSVYDAETQKSCLFVNLIDSSRYKQILKLKPTGEQNSFLDFIQSEDAKYLSLSVDEQLALIGNPQYSKIFMTHQDFYRIRMKQATVDNYLKYLKTVDVDFLNAENAESSVYEKRVEALNEILHKESHGKNTNDVFFEDLGVDSLVIDEEHVFKNSTDVSILSGEVTSCKYFSTPPASALGRDLLAKTHYVKNNNISKDGILGLTATPITNSPLEIYGLLSLVIGEYFINKLLAVNGIKEFLQLFCSIEQEDDYSIDGDLRPFKVFKGINNLKLLRNLMFKCTYFLHSDDEVVQKALKLPDEKMNVSSIDINKYQMKQIEVYKKAYWMARQALSILSHEGEEAFNAFLKEPETITAFAATEGKLRENVFITSSPFNFIRKMERLVLDEDLNEMATIFFVPNSYQKQVEEAVQLFNNKKLKQTKKPRLNPHTEDSSIFKVDVETYENSDGIEVEKKRYSFYTKAYTFNLNQNTDEKLNDVFEYITENNPMIDVENDTMVLIDSLQPKDQEHFFKLLQKTTGLSENQLVSLLKFNVSGKVKQFLTQYEKELNAPRGLLSNENNTDLVKQLVFCDYLGIHFKIKYLIAQKFNILVEKIELLSGQYNNDNEVIQSLQDGFNAENDENLYQTIIANEKAETGIDLQIGTQAIHHITIGWTPDGITQRNGRGVRQGNKTEYVNVYYYDTRNTFDTYKRNLVNKKNDWISALINSDDMENDFVQLIEIMSREQQDRMIELIGQHIDDEELLKQYEEENRIKEQRRVKQLQNIYLDFIVNNNKKKTVNKSNHTAAEFMSFIQSELFYIASQLNKHRNSLLNNISHIVPKGTGGQPFYDVVSKLRNNGLSKKTLMQAMNYTSTTSSFSGETLGFDKAQRRDIKSLIMILNYLDTLWTSYISKFNNLQSVHSLNDVVIKMINSKNNPHDFNNWVYSLLLDPQNSDLSGGIEALKTVNDNINNMAKTGYKNLCNTSQHIFYPSDILEHIGYIHKFHDSFVCSDGYIVTYQPSTDLNQVFNELTKLIKDGNTLFQVGSSLNNYLNKNKINIFTIDGKNINQSKCYPIDSISFSTRSNKAKLLPELYFAYKKSNLDDLVSKKINSKYLFNTYFHNHAEHSLIFEVLALMDYFYLSSCLPVENFDNLTDKDENILNQLRSTQKILKQVNPFVFNKKYLPKMLSQSLLVKEGKNHYQNLIELIESKNQLALSFKYEDYVKPNAREYEDVPFDILSKYGFSLENVQKVEKNAVSEYNEVLVDECLKQNGISIPKNEFFIVKHPNSYQLHEQFNFRSLAGECGEDIIFHKTNANLIAENHNAAYDAFYSKSGRNPLFFKTWIVGSNTLEYLIYKILLTDKRYLKNLSVYSTDGDLVSIFTKGK